MELVIMPYCEQCPKFKPVCDDTEWRSASQQIFYQRKITCENYNVCKLIEKNIVNEISKEFKKEIEKLKIQ